LEKIKFSKMTVYRTDKIILREKIKANPDVLYLFGDNLLRKGLGGQAKEMRGEENTIGILSKKYPSNKEDSFYSDKDFYNWLQEFSKDISKVAEAVNSGKYKSLVIPQIGVGLADLSNRAPRIWQHLKTTLDNL
jgi:hypothetical protein